MSVYFLNLLLKPARPINPEANRSMVAGSGNVATFYTFTYCCVLKQIDNPNAIRARLLLAREKASGEVWMMSVLSNEPTTARRKANAARAISALVMYCIVYLLVIVPCPCSL